MENNLRGKMVDSIEEGTLLEHLEEVGKIRLDYLTDWEVENLDLMIKVLDEDYNLPCRETHDIQGWMLENLHYQENMR